MVAKSRIVRTKVVIKSELDKMTAIFS